MANLVSSTALDAELDFWQAAGSTVRVEYSRAVMEELRLSAVDGFNRLAHGGVEIGGVLFGVRDSDAVKILAHRALACEYAFGPSFTLSDNDQRKLENLLASPQTDGELSAMQPVGWYHSHTRSEILLSEKDLEFFNDYFLEPWQVALVLRPHRFDPVRAGFFFREPDGSVHSASSRLEFIIPSRGRKPGLSSPGDGLPPDDVGAAASLAVAEPAMPAASPLPPAVSVEPTGVPALLPIPPSRAVARNTRRRWVWSAAAVAVTLTAVLLWTTRPHRSAEVSLRAIDVGGQLRIDWNRNSLSILQSESGALVIEDGSVKLNDELSSEYLRAGNITYLRSTGDVMVRLLVRGRDGSTLTEMTRFHGPPVAAATLSAIDSASRPAKVDSTKEDAAPAAPMAEERDREAPAERVAKQTPRPPGRAQTRQAPPPRSARTMTPREIAAALAFARRRPLIPPVIPPAGVRRPAETVFPVPPAIAVNTAANTIANPAANNMANNAPPPATSIPQLPAPVPPKPADQGPPPKPANQSAPAKLADQGPMAGKIIWTGKLSRSSTIQILGNRASQGQITGALPGAPVRVRVFPAEMTQEGLRIFTADTRSMGAPEAPGAQNGWNRTVYVYNPKKAGEIGIVEAPGHQNSWNRLTLRAERGDHSIIVLQWERVPGDASIRVAGGQ